MIAILPQEETIGGNLGRGLGEGLSAGLSARLTDFYKNKQEQRQFERDVQKMDKQQELKQNFAESDVGRYLKKLRGAEDIEDEYAPRKLKRNLEELEETQKFKTKLVDQFLKENPDIPKDEQRLIKSSFSGFIPKELTGQIYKTRQKKLEDTLKQQKLTQFNKKIEGKELKDLDFGTILEGAQLDLINPGAVVELLRAKSKPETSQQTRTELAQYGGFNPEFFQDVPINEAVKLTQTSRKNINDFNSKITQQALDAEEGLQSIGLMREALQQGAADPFTAGALAEQFRNAGYPLVSSVFDAYASGDAGKFNAASKVLFSDLTSYFGARPNQFVEQLFKSFLPRMGQSREANLAGLDVLEKMADALVEPLRIRDRIREEKGYDPWNIDDLVRTELANKKNDSFSQFVDSLKSFDQQFNDGKIDSKEKKLQKPIAGIQTPTTTKTFEELPSAKLYKGQRFENEESGEVYISDGTRWKKV